MKIVQWKRVFTSVIILLILNQCIFSQVVVERSKEKVVISGIQYYVHHVKKGETAYSISKAYGISVSELTKENPPALYGVNEGQILRIPVVIITAVTKAESKPVIQHDESKYIYHTLKPGETVYFLSKSYGVSESEIIQSNPGIDISKLSVGAEIAVPRRKFTTDQQKFESNQKDYIYHKVLFGESLSSIAEKYGLTVRVLRRANRDLRFPQVGDYVRIPGVRSADVIDIEEFKLDTLMHFPEEPVIKLERPSDYTLVNQLSGSLNVAVLLPFYLKENSVRTETDSSKSSKGKKILKVAKKDDAWIYPWSLDFIEMYEGILLAADTLRSLGLDINIYSYDIKSDTFEISRIIRAGKLADMDLIIGPVYSQNLSIVADYARTMGIPVVSPVPLYNNDILLNNPEIFLASSSLEIAQMAVAKKIGEYPDNNIVFIHSDTTGTDQDVKRFRNLILSELSSILPYEDIKFKEFIFYSRSMFDNDSINRLSHALSEHSGNIIIIASEDPPVISETIIDVHSLSRKFSVKVFGYPVMRDMDNLDPKYFFDLDIMIFSPYWIDYNNRDVQEFNADFRQKFFTEPLEKSYAWQGYDIAYYFISGLAIHGKDFVLNPQSHRPDLLQTDFDFIQKNTGDGFENQKLFPVIFSNEYEIKLAE